MSELPVVEVARREGHEQMQARGHAGAVGVRNRGSERSQQGVAPVSLVPSGPADVIGSALTTMYDQVEVPPTTR